MKNKICIFTIISLIISLFSCTPQENNQDIQTVKVNNLTHPGKINLSTIFPSVNLIPLQTPETIVIDDIRRIVTTEEHVLIADKSAIYKFDKQGNFIRHFNKKGPGPEEYTSITDFAPGNENDIWVLNRANKTLFHYNWEGELIAKQTIEGWADRFFKYEDAAFLYFGNNRTENNYKLKKQSLTGNENPNSYLTIDPNKSNYLHVHSTNLFSTVPSSEDIFFYEIFNDTIYKITGDHISPHIHLALENKNIPTEFFKKEYDNIAEFFQDLFQNSYAYGTGLFIENNKSYLLSYIYEKKYFYSLINKQTKESLSFHTLYEDIHLKGYPVHLIENEYFILADNNIAIILDSMDIIEYAEENLPEEEYISLREKIKYDPELLNPVILIIDTNK